MERILSVQQMRSADEYTIKKLGFSQNDLIERAGKAVTDEILKRFKGGRVLVCMGKGNNGKDGRVVADILSKLHGFTVASISVSNGIFKLFDKSFDIIVDCIFGTGLNKNVEGKYLEAIDKINNSGAFVVSCDIPSGLNGDTGLVMGKAVKANLTVAIQEYKLGHFLNDGPDYTGKLVVKDIGISIWGEDYIKKINGEDAERCFPERKRNTNKGSFGKIAIMGGSKEYSGSALLSYNALCGLKMGVGYSTLVVPDCLFGVSAFINPECVLTTIKDENGQFTFDKDKLDGLMNNDCIVFGMGVGISFANYQIIKYFLENYKKRLVIDADGLNSLAKFGVDILENHKCEVVISPHIMEFSRLINKDKNDILENSVVLAKEFAQKYKIVVVLKSATTVITDGDVVFLNTTGNSGLAKAGSGDVLSGIIGGLCSRKLDLIDCVTTACYLFGITGDKCKGEQNEYTITASDVINVLPQVIDSL